MAWTPLRTYVTGELVTAAILNTDHRDNLKMLYRVRHAQAIGAAGANLVEIVNTGAQSYPGYECIFEVMGALLNTNWGTFGSIVLYDGAVSTGLQIVGNSNSNTNGWIGTRASGSVRLTPSAGTHTYRLVYGGTGGNYGGEGTFVIWERGG